MGDQSSGKSSVLEALSGIPFPRGSGLGFYSSRCSLFVGNFVVTRCPCRLIMRTARPGDPWSAVAYTSTNPNSKRFLSTPRELTSAIESLTELLTSSSSGFSTEVIHVEV